MRCFAGAALSIALGGCVLPSALPESSSLISPRGHIVVIGKVELIPAINPELEQQSHWNILGDGDIANRVMLATDTEALPITTGAIKASDWREFIDARWGQYFAVVVPRSDRYLNGVAVPLDIRSQDYLWFPGGMVLRPPDTGDLIYAGTLRYTRNDFNQITQIEVADESDEARQYLRDRYDRDPDELVTWLWVKQFPWESGEL